MKAAVFQPEPLTVAAGEFKAKCLKLMDDANEKHQPIVVTKRGKVVGQFVPASTAVKPFRSVFGRTPGARLPDESAWRKSKDTWASEWDKSAARLARQISGDFSEDE